MIILVLLANPLSLMSLAEEDATVYNACINNLPSSLKGWDLIDAKEDCERKQRISTRRKKAQLERIKSTWEISNYKNKRSCGDWAEIYTKEYPVSGTVEANTELGSYSPDGCESSRLYLECESGSCFVNFYSRPHGFFPGQLNKASIDGKVWSWRGDFPARAVGHEMWKAIKDKSIVGLEFVLWPYKNVRTFKYSVSIPAGLKNKVYQSSLQKPL